MAPFNGPYTTLYWFAIVNIALSCTIFELFDVEYRDLEIGVRRHSRSLKLVPFESLGAVSYSPFFPPIPHQHSTPPLRGFLSEYRHPVWHGKTRMTWLPDGEKNSKI